MKLSWILILVVMAANCAAQKQQKIYFRKNDGRYLPTREGCDYMQLIQETGYQTNIYNVFEYYPDSAKKFIGQSTKIVPLNLEGPAMSYFHNGKKMRFCTYKDNKPVGLVYDFYPNGKPYTVKDYLVTADDSATRYNIIACLDSAGKALVTDGNGYFAGFDDDFEYLQEYGKIKDGKRDSLWTGKDEQLKLSFTERYDNGKLMTGLSVDSAGVKHSYQQRRAWPQYKGGYKAFRNFLSKRIVYPIDAQNRSYEGMVLLSFTIEKDGVLNDIKVLHGVDLIMDKEAIRVLKASAVNWRAGTAYGIPVKVGFSVPINFTIDD
ncbi:energy transducer TonB [Mucilaginibacter sp. UR6-11]|uniref:energy transducer TonB n=1 Tax=Mucilaginibacter sp. UR6-11 TaxID=1435644 RepID=UPI001E2EE56B|nr:energy transducer TonB [Mucilaginibacter sp. UR6-11]MCC8424488.1 TonB family protein [Mucilaginibacter sp. UR6-11]